MHSTHFRIQQFFSSQGKKDVTFDTYCHFNTVFFLFYSSPHVPGKRSAQFIPLSRSFQMINQETCLWKRVYGHTQIHVIWSVLNTAVIQGDIPNFQSKITMCIYEPISLIVLFILHHTMPTFPTMFSTQSKTEIIV